MHQNGGRSYHTNEGRKSMQTAPIFKEERSMNNNNCLCHIFDDCSCWVIILALILVFCCCNN